MYKVVQKKLHKILHVSNFPFRIALFTPKCTAEITFYQLMQNLFKWIMYYLLNSQTHLQLTHHQRHKYVKNTWWPSCKQMFLT